MKTVRIQGNTRKGSLKFGWIILLELPNGAGIAEKIVCIAPRGGRGDNSIFNEGSQERPVERETKAGGSPNGLESLFGERHGVGAEMG